MALSPKLKDYVKTYFENSSSTPLFAAVDSDAIAHDFSGNAKFMQDAEKLFVDDFFEEDDRPNLGALRDELNRRFAEKENYHVILLGVGEYLAFRGAREAEMELRSFYDVKLFNGGKLMLPLRCVTNILQKIADRNDKFRNACQFNKTLDASTLRVGLVSPSLSLRETPGNKNKRFTSVDSNGVRVEKEVLPNFKELMRRLALGAMEVYAQTRQKPGSDYRSYSFDYIENNFSILLGMEKLFTAADKELGTSEQWQKLTDAVSKAGSFDQVCDKNDVPQTEDDLYHRFPQKDFKGWLYFLRLKQRLTRGLIPAGSYLEYVLQRTSNVDDLRSNLLNALLEIEVEDRRFERFYNDRLRILRNFKKTEMDGFVRANRRDPHTALERLSATTEPERREIITHVAQHGWKLETLERIYPALAQYLAPCVVPGVNQEMTERLTNYFARYREQKLANHIDDSFRQEVEELADKGYYLALTSRDAVVDKLYQESLKGTKTTLLWLDALGVEFVPYIERLCAANDLVCRVQVARANIPTITSENRSFYDNWTGEREADKELDETKHKEKGGFDYEKTPYPIHLERELEIVKRTIEIAAARLDGGADRVVVASDHGASRLAVISGQEEKCDGDARGQHSGRCCPVGAGDVPENVPGLLTDENWHVFANYTRFPHSRKANVEVHGGATLEEVVVPVVVISKRSENARGKIEFMNPVVKKGTSRNPAALEVFAETGLNNPALEIIMDGAPVRFEGERLDDNHFRFVIQQIRKTGEYTAKVVDDEEIVATLTFELKAGGGRLNDAW